MLNLLSETENLEFSLNDKKLTSKNSLNLVSEMGPWCWCLPRLLQAAS